MPTREQELDIGVRARRIYEDQKERIDSIRQNLHNKWEGSNADDVAGREATWNMLKALNELERSYLTDIDTGKLAQAEIEESENG